MRCGRATEYCRDAASKSATGGAGATAGSTAGSTATSTQCSTALPSGAALVDTTTATVIGTGTPDSCKVQRPWRGKYGALIVNSVFTNNSASNAGAVGGLFAELDIYNTLFDHNTATGHDANNNEPDKCDAINNDQNETGSGGNGGAMYQDAPSTSLTLRVRTPTTRRVARALAGAHPGLAAPRSHLIYRVRPPRG